MVPPWKARRKRPCRHQTSSGYAVEERRGLEILCIEGGVAGVTEHSALRESGSQGLRQQSPTRIQARVKMFELPADIGRIIAVEVRCAIGPVGIAAIGVAIEQTERHQRIEEIARAARVKSEAGCEYLPFKPVFAKL